MSRRASRASSSHVRSRPYTYKLCFAGVNTLVAPKLKMSDEVADVIEVDIAEWKKLKVRIRAAQRSERRND